MLNPTENIFEEPSLASSGNRSAGSTPPTREGVLATFKVGSAVLNSGLVRPITLFPINTTIKTPSPNSLTAPDVPIGPHQGQMDVCVKRNNWMASSAGHIDRRYSELVDFRAVLTYQFPTMIVPPLPIKSTLENLGTFFTSESMLTAQQHSIVRFLREVGMTSEFVYFSTYTPEFFQLPRESFTECLARMRATLAEFRRRNASIDAYSTRRGGILGGDSVSSITNTSTKAVRRFVGMLQSWVGGGEDGALNETGTPALNAQHTQTNGAGDGSNRYSNNEEYWDRAIQTLEGFREALTEAAKPYVTYMQQSFEAANAEKDLAEAFANCAKCFAASSANRGLATVMEEANTFTGNAASALDGQQGRNRREMHERLLFEISYIDAALDAIDHVQCIWKYCNALIGQVSYRDFLAYAQSVSTKLQVFYEMRFLPNFRLRMGTMMSRNAATSLAYAVAVENTLKSSSLTKTVSDPAYMDFNTDI